MDNLWQPLKHHISPLFAALGAIVGCLLYFSLPFEPAPALLWGGSAIVLATGLAQCKWRAFYFPLALFWLWSAVYTQLVDPYAPIPQHTVWINGTIEDMERRNNNRVRITAKDVQLFDETLTVVPRLRFSVSAKRAEGEALAIGGGVAAQVLLQPPQQPQFVGDFDQRFYSYFDGRSASGYVRGGIYSTHVAAYSGLWPTFTRWRQQLTARIEAVASPLAAALLTGRRDGLDAQVKEDFRASGLAHLLAISGLHIGLVGGLVFFGLRFGFTFIPQLALRYPIKHISAVIALLFSIAYMVLAGMTIPTLRATLMVGLLFASILLIRPKNSLRLWSIAVLIVLALWPYAVITASFQLSFVATFALLIWAHMQLQERDIFTPKITYMRGVLMTSVIAGLATLPFTAWHFGEVSLMGILMNLAAIPLMGFWVMPFGVFALILLPVGLEAWPLMGMEYGLHFMRILASFGASSPLAGVSVTGVFMLLVTVLVGLIFYLLLQQHKRLAVVGVGALAVLLLVWPASSKVSVVLLDKGQTALLCNSNHICSILFHGEDKKKRTAKWYAKQKDILLEEIEGVCDASGCVYSLAGLQIAVTENPTAEDCALADVLLSPSRTQHCPSHFQTLAPAAELLLPQQTKKTFWPRIMRPWQRPT